MGSDVDGDIHAGREVELLQLIDRLGGGLDDVDEALVRARLELLHGLFIHVRGTVDRKFFDAGGQRDGTGNTGAGALGGFDDFQGGLIDHAIVEALEFDANTLAFHGGDKERGLSAGWGFGRGLDNLGENRVGHLLEVGRSDRGAGSTLR